MAAFSLTAAEKADLSQRAESTGSAQRDRSNEAIVLQPLSGADWGLTDAEREERIVSLGDLMVGAMELYAATGDFGYRGDADRLRDRMTALVKSRPPEFVRRLENERGLA